LTKGPRARDSTPSQNDFNTTRISAYELSLFDIVLHDHFIAGRAECRNLRGDSQL
jgi:DNA repair protein RadC